ncbi:hypothetical protein ACH4FX_12820 [Streptomyces sp. NPDC018019]
MLLEKADRGDARPYLRQAIESALLVVAGDGVTEPAATGVELGKGKT